MKHYLRNYYDYWELREQEFEGEPDYYALQYECGEETITQITFKKLSDIEKYYNEAYQNHDWDLVSFHFTIVPQKFGEDYVEI
jgi:hypothetical protein